MNKTHKDEVKQWKEWLKAPTISRQAERLAEALQLALVQWPAAHRDQPRIIAQMKSALAEYEKARQQ